MEHQISRTRPRGASFALLLAVALGLAFVAAPSGHAQTYRERVLHTFTGPPDGSTPYAGLLRDASGNLYGTTWGGGASGTGCGGSGCGTVYKLDTSGNEAPLYSFTGTLDGYNPYAAVITDAAGNLFGTTKYGAGTEFCGAGCGTVYELTEAGDETVLYSFTGSYTGDGRRISIRRSNPGYDREFVRNYMGRRR